MIKWRTLVVLQEETHKDQLKKIGKNMNIPPSRIIGKLIETFIKKYDIRNGGE